MRKIFLYATRNNSYELAKNVFGKGISITILHDTRVAIPSDDSSLILADCDYKCCLDSCLRKYLFLYNHRSIPIAMLKTAVIKDVPDSGWFFLRILNEKRLYALQDDLFSSLRISRYYTGSPEFLVLPFSSLNKIIQVQRVIVESYQEAFRLSDLARIAEWSPSWLSYKFRNLTGISLKNFLVKSRCCRALWQLISTDKPVKTIGLESGYQPLYFSQLFNKVFNEPPSAIRNRLAQGHFVG
ncbi:MAG TPA: AraC family transcriptional regulator [Candidatus Saccharicenans sp.]|nr:AraC family transcriptional regulator [Candidatus Saccharicenans sp.]HQM73978.1 AraC family transcriptional regulator [Candidatus Saccharicenans sp.]